MPLTINLRHLEAHNLRLEGELPVAELDIETRDEMLQLGAPLEYELEAQKLEGGLLIEGRLRLPLRCQCVRCLKVFDYPMELESWVCHLPLEGEESAPVINDCVDLTPYLREDILLEFPQHPLCEPECRGLPTKELGQPQHTSSTGQPEAGSPAWAELNKLKL
jgi:uncharacterized protein